MLESTPVTETKNVNDSPSTDETTTVKTIPNKVFVGNLAFRTNFKSLKEAFSKVGTVERVNVVSKDGKRLGFGFVQFSSEEEATKAIKEMNDTELDGRTIKFEQSVSTKRPRRKNVKRAPKKENLAAKDNTKKSKQTSTKGKPAKSEEPKKDAKPRRVRIPLSEREVSDDTVYVSNLSEETSEEAVKKLFADYDVSEVIIHYAWRGKNNPKLRFAFVTVDPKKQQKAVDDINEKEFEGNTLTAKCAHKPVTKEQIDAARAKLAEKPKKKKN